MGICVVARGESVSPGLGAGSVSAQMQKQG